MRISSIDIKGFGRLANRHYEFPPGKAILVIAENERGKSTLANAILAGLCGFPSRKAGGAMKPGEVYRPWGGSDYAVEMLVESRAGQLRIERDFARNTFIIRSTATNKDITAECQADLALQLLNLPREDFRRIAYVSGKDMHEFSASDRIQARLSSLVEGGHADEAGEVAITALESATYTHDGRRVKPGTVVARISAKITEKMNRMATLDSALDACEHDVTALDDLHARQASLTSLLQELDVEYRSARLAELHTRICAAEADGADQDGLRAELQSLEPHASHPTHRASHLSGAAARLKEHTNRLGEMSASIASLHATADDLRSALAPFAQFATANHDDLVHLRSSREVLASAQKAYDQKRYEARFAGPAKSRAIGYALTIIGALSGIGSAALAILRRLDLVPSLIGAVLGAAVAAAGLVMLSRTGSARAALTSAGGMLSDANERAVRRLSLLGVTCSEESDLIGLIERTSDALEGYLSNKSRLREVDLDLASETRKLDELKERVDDERSAIGSILAEAHIDASLPIEIAMERFDEANAHHRRYREIKDALLPALERRSLKDDALTKLRVEESELAAQSGPLHVSPRTMTEVETEQQSARAEMQDIAESIRELDRTVGLQVAEYRREYPALKDQVESLERELARASRFESALAMAAEVLREVTEQTHHQWAAALNHRASAMLPSLNPDYDTLRFDESLAFTIRSISDNRIIDKPDIDARLSTGAKDQIYLAVRLACCAELSRDGESVPIILDDPLIATDDQRFATGMRYLVESLPHEHQVIILTCHRARHEMLASESWFADGAMIVDL